MAEKLTDTLIADLECPNGRKDVIVFDASITGFAVRVTSGGTRTFLLQYKFAGKARRFKIGKWPGINVAKARRQAAAARGKVMEGVDPAAARKRVEKDVAASEAARVDCDAMFVDYPDALATRGKSAKYQKDELSHVRHGLAAMGAGKLTPVEITPTHIDKMVAAFSAGVARARFDAIARFLSWALKRTGDRTSVPATATFDRHEKPAQPAPRERWWSQEEVSSIWRACEGLRAGTARDLALFLLTTPCRSGEAANMRLAHIDLVNRVWSQPTSKNTDPHHLPLNELAVEVLSRRIAALGENPARDALVFAGSRKGKPYSSWSNLAEAVARRLKAAKTPVVDWEWHDTRRTFNTTLADRGIDEGLLDQILNHRASKSRGGVKRHYQFAERWGEKVRALAEWDAVVRHALSNPNAPTQRKKVRAP